MSLSEKVNLLIAALIGAMIMMSVIFVMSLLHKVTEEEVENPKVIEAAAKIWDMEIEAKSARNCLKNAQEREEMYKMMIGHFVQTLRVRRPTLRIDHKNKELKIGDIVLFNMGDGVYARRVFDKNGFIFPHIKRKLCMGIFIRGGEDVAWIYDLQGHWLFGRTIYKMVPQQNVVTLNWQKSKRQNSQ